MPTIIQVHRPKYLRRKTLRTGWQLGDGNIGHGRQHDGGIIQIPVFVYIELLSTTKGIVGNMRKINDISLRNRLLIVLFIKVFFKYRRAGVAAVSFGYALHLFFCTINVDQLTISIIKDSIVHLPRRIKLVIYDGP